MAKNKKHRQFDLEDFRRYRDGEMSFGEQHNMERQLMEDPFLAEAYEGFLLMTEDKTDHLRVVETLEKDFRERKLDKSLKIKGLWMYASAAAIVLGLGITWLVSVNKEKVLLTSAASQTESVETPGKPESMEVLPAVPGPSKSSEGIVSMNSAEKSGSSFRSDAKMKADVPPHSIESAPDVSRLAEIEIKPETGIAYSSDQVKPAMPAPGIRIRGHAVQSRNADPDMAVTGSVRDENGEALPGAFVFSSLRSGTVADSNGNFVFNAKLGDSLKLAMIGYKGKVLNVDRADLGAIKMEADSKLLNEVVVVGYGTARKQSITGAVANAVSKPEPAGGWQAYQMYLIQKSYSIDEEGFVNVSFEVAEDGSLSDFKGKAEKRLLQKAIEMIKAGPAWLPGKENGKEVVMRANVLIVFRKH